MHIESVMLVCTGNICRSPMAEGLLRARLPGLRVNSSGLGALVGQPATAETVQLMQEQGIDIAAHRAQQISTWLLQNANLVLTAELEQKKYIERNYPQTRGRVFRIGEAQQLDIPDPYRQPLSQYQHSLALIDRGIADWVQKISKLQST